MDYSNANQILEEILEVYPDAIVRINLDRTGSTYVVTALKSVDSVGQTFYNVQQFESWVVTGREL